MVATPCIFLGMLAVPVFALFLSIPPQGSAVGSPPESFTKIETEAEAAKSANRLSEATELYSRAVQVRPGWSEGWWSLGSLLYDQDRFGEARAAFEKFIKLVPKPGPAYAFVALCEFETRQYDSALGHFQAWGKSGSPGTDALLDVAGYHWALLMTRKGQFQQALYLLEAKTKKLGPVPDLAEAMGLASLRMTYLPSEYPAEKRELVWLAGKTAVYAARHEYEKSDEYGKRLGARFPREPNVHYFLGTLLGFQNRFPEAAEQYKEELKLSPDHVPALTELAMVDVRNFDPESAVPVAEHAVELEPKNARALYALGKGLLDSGRFRESVPRLEAAKQYAPNSAQVRSALADAYRRAGRLTDAKREAAAFLALQDKEELLAPREEKARGREKPETQP